MNDDLQLGKGQVEEFDRQAFERSVKNLEIKETPMIADQLKECREAYEKSKFYDKDWSTFDDHDGQVFQAAWSARLPNPQPVVSREIPGEWDALTKKEMWDLIQRIRKITGDDGTFGNPDRLVQSMADELLRLGYKPPYWDDAHAPQAPQIEGAPTAEEAWASQAWPFVSPSELFFAGYNKALATLKVVQG